MDRVTHGAYERRRGSQIVADRAFARRERSDGRESPTRPAAERVTSIREPRRRHRVVVIGGGFGGLQVVRSLRHAQVDITLIDRRNFHLFQPLLYQVATGALLPDQIATPLRVILKRQKNAGVVMGEVRNFDFDLSHLASLAPVRPADGKTVMTPHRARVGEPYGKVALVTGAGKWDRLCHRRAFRSRGRSVVFDY